jgi:glycine/D-amino acid oxidase-like deaminating enzyme
VAALPALDRDVTADVVVVGGGYAGLWTAWHLRERGASVAVVEAGVCGHGPSGRNGGFCESLWMQAPALRRRLTDERALAVLEASEESVRAIGEWCEDHGVDAWFTARGSLTVSLAPWQDGTGDGAVEAAAALGAPDRVRRLTAAEVRAVCDLPTARGGVVVPGDGTVQPARLAVGLRARVAEAGAAIYEHSPANALRVTSAGVVARTARGAVHADTAVLAVNAAARGIAPLRGRLAVASSHIVLTEPVPDVLDALGWTGGQGIADGRTFLHYLRTTRDGRIAYGWGGGRLAYGARLGGRVELDPDAVHSTREHLLRMFPALAGRAVTHAWGGPIDVSPTHLPQVGALDGGRVLYALGFTGNGVGPSHLAARSLTALVAGEEPALPLVEPELRVPREPLAWAGGSLVRAALMRHEMRADEGRLAGPVTRALVRAPAQAGLHLAR